MKRGVVRWSMCRTLLAVLLVATPIAVTFAGDHVFNSTFDAAEEGPYSDAEAARLLTETTFGATMADIEHLRGIGYYAWLDEQFDMAPTLHQPFVHAIALSGEDVFQNIRREAWWTAAMFGPDQLRQRVAFALSELFVVSDQDNAPAVHLYEKVGFRHDREIMARHARYERCDVAMRYAPGRSGWSVIRSSQLRNRGRCQRKIHRLLNPPLEGEDARGL